MQIIKIIGDIFLTIGAILLVICSLVALAANKYKDKNGNYE